MSPFSNKIPIFVSSTMRDMYSYRDAVRGILNQFNADIRGMETFGAQTPKPLETCLKEVKSSEVYIGIIGMRYGSVDKRTGKSYVELEYEAAVKNNLEIKIYLINEEKANVPPVFVECKNVDKLNKFKIRLKNDHTCVTFISPFNLAEKVKGDLEKYFIKRSGILQRSKAFVSATVSTSTIAKGDEFFIAGTATEISFPGVAIWIFGNDFFTYSVVEVLSDASYLFKISSDLTKQMQIGQYFVVVQHPMENKYFDVIPVLSEDSLAVKNSFNDDKFLVQGKNSISGIEAATNLIEFLNNSTIDDTYAKIQFIIQDPFIRMNPLQSKKVGDKFTISADTNLAVDNEIVVELIPRIISPDLKIEFGIRGTVKVIKQDQDFNKIVFDIDLATAQVGEYTVNIISYKLGIIASQSLKVD